MIFEKLLTKEEIHWKQRSKNNWLADGDCNMSYFHKVVSNRRRRNNIQHLKTVNNTLTTNQKEIENIITNYYNLLFSTQRPTLEEIQNISTLIPPMVNQETKDCLGFPLSKEEV